MSKLLKVHQEGDGSCPPAVEIAAPDSCCEGAVQGVETGSSAFKRVVWVVLALNAAMFVVEAVLGQVAGSMSMQADALDFASDALTYGISLAVIGRSLLARSRAALFKGGMLGLVAAIVLGASLWRTFVEGVPHAATMGVTSVVALAVNLTAALLLLKFRDGDANVRSVWLCSRNDAIGNVAVLLAAGVVALTQTKWADLGVAVVMASLFLSTSVQIVRQARTELAAG
jgi:cation diffusion facilitator family transporter